MPADRECSRVFGLVLVAECACGQRLMTDSLCWPAPRNCRFEALDSRRRLSTQSVAAPPMAAAVGVSTTPPRGSRKARARAVAPAVLAAEEAMDVAKHSTDPTDMANSLRSPSASVRLAALKRLCPCKLRESAGRDEFEPVWSAIFALATDDDARIRAQVSLLAPAGKTPCAMKRRDGLAGSAVLAGCAEAEFAVPT